MGRKSTGSGELLYEGEGSHGSRPLHGEEEEARCSFADEVNIHECGKRRQRQKFELRTRFVDDVTSKLDDHLEIVARSITLWRVLKNMLQFYKYSKPDRCCLKGLRNYLFTLDEGEAVE